MSWVEHKGVDFSRRGQLWKSILVLAIPVAAQMILQSLLGMADVIMVGVLGSAAIAAVGLAAKMHFLLLVLMSGLATGCSILLAQYLGARDYHRCQRTLAVTLVVGSAIMIPLMLVFGVAAHTWVGWINPDPEVVDLAAQYLVITAPVLIITQWIVIYEAALRTQGQTALPLLAGVVAAIVNILLNYALISGNWGFPAMGVAGAAWATVIARALQLMVLLGWVYGKKHNYALSLAQLREGFDRQQVARYLGFSLPLVANYAIWAIGNSTYHFVTGFAGTQALAVMGVIVPIESAFFALFVGLANASAVLVGRELGAGNNDNAWRLHQFFDRLTIVLLVVFSLSLWFLRPWIASIFDQLDAAATQLLLNTLAVFCLLVWVKIINMMRIIGVLRAGGDNRFTLITDTIVMWVFGLPIYMAAVFLSQLSFVYLYAFMFLEDGLKFIPVIRRVISRKWMNNLSER
ncbi:MATE family efflux transporter [Cellvibrio japonicus]|uniref:Multidrug-efflux transporter n=1 Tax=Cellvibrio japonicus (strain Ueda107) TaxID=498211 RepID=B3PF65_CELJU|nr:MATE family efflux transporter [Cellvibrio japonicus]ACE85551.1 MATE efflux family protein subfamily [Cellvibrio japonicus Ueda107]